MFLITESKGLSQAISQLTLYKYSLSAWVAVYRIPNGGKNSERFLDFLEGFLSSIVLAIIVYKGTISCL